MPLCHNADGLSHLPSVTHNSDVVHPVVVKSSGVERVSLSDYVASRLRRDHQIDSSVLLSKHSTIDVCIFSSSRTNSYAGFAQNSNHKSKTKELKFTPTLTLR